MSDILQIENGVLISCTDKGATSVTIPDGVTKIGNYAFLSGKAISLSGNCLAAVGYASLLMR